MWRCGSRGPPGPWAWLALGSEARHEQSLVTDQDRALVFVAPDVSPEEADAYFERLARRVTDGLAEAGIPRCGGGVMAESAAWRADRETWIRTFREQLALSDVGGRRSRTSLSTIAGSRARSTSSDHRPARPAGGGRRMARPEARLVGPRSPPPTGFFREFLVGWDGARPGRSM